MLRAITTNNTKEVSTILNEDFNVNQPIDRKYGYNSLQYAALLNRYNVIELLLLYGANIDAKDKFQNTPLILATEKHNLESINSLMKNGCDRSIKNKYGLSAEDKAKKIINSEYLVNFIKNYPETKRSFPKF